MKILAVGDDNFTLTPCILNNIEQWSAKVRCAPSQDGPESETEQKAPWKIEVACCLPLDKIPAEYMANHDKLCAQGVNIHYSVNPALLRQYFTTFNNEGEDKPGPPYDVVLCVLPGLQFDGLPRFVDRKSELFKLRLHMYFFALTKSSTVITKKNGAIMFLWVDQDATNLLNRDLPFPLVDIHKLGPFCKIQRSPEEDFRLNLSWGDYKTRWKPILHNVELLNFPSFLEDLKVYVFRNSPYVEKESQPIASTGEENNLLRIPQSICQWNRTVLTHVNELFHFNMRTSVPGESLQISKLSVKYDPRINGWRNLGTVQRTETQRPSRPVPQQQQPRTFQEPMQQQAVPTVGPVQANAWPGQSSTYGAGYAEPIQRYTSYSSAPPYETGLSSLLQGWPTQQQESSNYNPYAPAGGQATTTSLPQTSEFDMYAPASGPQVTKQPAESVRREFDRKSSGTPAVAHANERSGYDETTRLYEESPARGGYEPSRRDSWPRRSDPGPYSRRKPRREVYDESRRSERYHGGDDHDRGRVYR